jgi:glyoxylase-like metal-dependent hydrolase (beta-lactamase superfamily II)
MAKIKIEQIKDNTYYIPSLCNIGIFKENDNITLIDSGNNKEVGRQVLKAIKDNGWQLLQIINTHSNADHIGGNAFIQKRTDCLIAATRKESVFINYPELEPSFLNGGFPWPEIENKFLKAEPSTVTDVISSQGKILESSLEAISLPGHFYEMIGIQTSDNVVHLADVLFSEEILSKYHIVFLYDVAGQLISLENLKNLKADYYLISHGGVYENISTLIEMNKNKILEIIQVILNFCKKNVSFDDLLVQVCETYKITLDPNQFVLVGSTLRSYLSYLARDNKIEIMIKSNKMVIKGISYKD